MSPLKGGKTPPRLLADLKRYNPDKLPQNGYNVISELAFPFEEGRSGPRTTGKGSCTHRWVLKPTQTSPPLVDTKIPHISFAAAHCIDCLRHVKLTIDTTKSEIVNGSCPNSSHPLHHFRYEGLQSRGYTKVFGSLNSWHDERTFICSAATCQASLTVFMHSPVLAPEYVRLLTDREDIKNRAEAAIASEPERLEGHAPPHPLQVMAYLKTYIDNSFQSDPRKIPLNNKKWLLCLGDPCQEMLEQLGFVKEDEFWSPPQPDTTDTEPYTKPLNLLLSDVLYELKALMMQQPDEDRRVNKIFPEVETNADFGRKLLSCDEYPRSLSSRTSALRSEDEHPYYAGLGATGDFHDNLIQFAYERQIDCDPTNNSYYLESLNGIAEGRGSEDLKTKAAIEASTGKLSNSEFKEAYAAFNLDIHDMTLDDDHIIGVFQSRASDAPLQEPELRRNLNIIGKHRNSRHIEDFASNTVTTYEQALSWLGAQAEMDDSFIVAMHGVKVNESPLQAELASTCVKIIADHRGSAALQQWLISGELGDVEMNVSHAYQLLEIPDKDVADDLIIPSYLVLVGDNPSKQHNYQKALRTIAEDRKSAFLQSYLADTNADQETGSVTWPVGLSNIGNTCYLNSLLQYFFSIKPVRELVLDFDNYKEDLDDVLIKNKQVGGRKISRAEAKRSQDFTQELQQLFKNMIESSSKTVTPRKELAHLTILSSQSEADVKIRRESVSLSARRPMSQAEAMSHFQDGATLTSPPRTAPTNNALDAIQDEDAMDEDVDSESTLVDKSQDISMETELMKQSEAFENKENLAPTVEEIPRPRSPEKVLEPLCETSPSRANEQISMSPLESEKVLDDATIQAAPERRPPPVPPRNKVIKKDDELLKEAEFEATQRDVTEVIDNVFFQLQCAIKPDIVSADSDPTDTMKQLFYGKSREIYPRGKVESKDAIFQDIKIQIPDGPRHIYNALDAVFDEHNVRLGPSIESRHSTILELPPILQIFVSRGQFDKTKGTASKSMHHLGLEKVIYMDRYLETKDEDLLKRKSDSWKWKRELRDLTARRTELTNTDIALSMPEALEATAAYLRQLTNEDDAEEIKEREQLADQIKEAGAKASKEIQGLYPPSALQTIPDYQVELDKRIAALQVQLDSQFTDLKAHPYRLFSVFIHLGGLSSGHYWIFIHDFQSDVWRKYNDGYVTEVEEKEVFSAGDHNRPSTSTFVVYVKAGMEDILTQPICRDIRDRPLDAATVISPEEKLSQWANQLQATDGDVSMG